MFSCVIIFFRSGALELAVCYMSSCGCPNLKLNTPFVIKKNLVDYLTDSKAQPFGSAIKVDCWMTFLCKALEFSLKGGRLLIYSTNRVLQSSFTFLRASSKLFKLRYKNVVGRSDETDLT